MAKKTPTEKPVMKLYLADPNSTPADDLKKIEDGPQVSPLIKSMLAAMKEGEERIQGLAFERDPTTNNEYGAIYRQKTRLIPDFLLKRVAIQDDLVASIINARSNQMSAFGRPQPDRF